MGAPASAHTGPCPAGWRTGIDATVFSFSIVQLATAASRPPCRASLRDGFVGLDPATTPMDLGGCEKDKDDQQPEPQPKSGCFSASREPASSSSARQARASSAGSGSGRCGAGHLHVHIAAKELQRRKHQEPRCQPVTFAPILASFRLTTEREQNEAEGESKAAGSKAHARNGTEMAVLPWQHRASHEGLQGRGVVIRCVHRDASCRLWCRSPRSPIKMISLYMFGRKYT
ncbi:MAG: hypothetical protein M3Y39_08945 [Chloroflexota bacterium]|nr:hypothetical protein [Chloroflexota bacterium]